LHSEQDIPSPKLVPEIIGHIGLFLYRARDTATPIDAPIPALTRALARQEYLISVSNLFILLNPRIEDNTVWV
jgi:hypothetical protein